jgi:hypothetical protein
MDIKILDRLRAAVVCLKGAMEIPKKFKGNLKAQTSVRFLLYVPYLMVLYLMVLYLMFITHLVALYIKWIPLHDNS